MSKKLITIGLGVVLTVLSFVYTSFVSIEKNPLTASAETGIKVGQDLPAFTLNRLDGGSVTVGQSGKITVINFWATWCPPCREEIPDLDAFARQNQEKVDFYAINLQESNVKVSEFMNSNGYTMSVLLDENGVIAEKFKIAAIPTTIIVNKHGMIKYRKSGAMTRNELEGIINSL